MKAILILMLAVLIPSVAYGTEAQLTFSWTVEEDIVVDQKITELRVYQDSSSNMVGTTNPLSGIIKLTTDIQECSNFWATYATEVQESYRTDPPIVVCRPDEEDPLPARKVMSVNGLKVTIEFDPSKWE